MVTRKPATGSPGGRILACIQPSWTAESQVIKVKIIEPNEHGLSEMDDLQASAAFRAGGVRRGAAGDQP